MIERVKKTPRPVQLLRFEVDGDIYIFKTVGDVRRSADNLNKH